jgi:type VI secretion system FHA domain protein
MLLTLALVGPSSSSDVPEPQRVFDQSGGTIGRLPDNDWILADARVSGHHAVVRFAGGTFYLEDTSRNGIFLNSSDRPLTRGQRYPLKSGDRLRIDPFEIEAMVSGAPAAVALTVGDPFALDKSSGIDRNAPSVDPLALLGLQSIGGAVPPPRQDPVPEPSSILHERCHLASPVPPVLEPARLKPAPAPALAAPSLPERFLPDAPDEATAVGTLASTLAAAGVTGVAATPDLARRFGSLLRVVVDGMMRVLEARQQVKEDFRIGRTRFRPRDNNPLRLSANVDDALHNLLIKRNPAYLGLVEAFEDAFDELQDHQSATHAAMRTAFDAALAAFHSPRPSGHGFWTRCRRFLGDVPRQSGDSLQTLFGDEFKRAYDEERRRLKDARLSVRQ